jgi:FdhD protein
MRTPGADRELAAGFLLTEGVITSASDLFDLTACVSAGARARECDRRRIGKPSTFDATKLSRHVFTSSSCAFAQGNDRVRH